MLRSWHPEHNLCNQICVCLLLFYIKRNIFCHIYIFIHMDESPMTPTQYRVPTRRPCDGSWSPRMAWQRPSRSCPCDNGHIWRHGIPTVCPSNMIVSTLYIYIHCIYSVYIHLHIYIYMYPSKIKWDLTNGPRSVSCDRTIRYSGFFGVREKWVLLEISWSVEVVFFVHKNGEII